MLHTEWRSKTRVQNGKRGIWQRHDWEHYIRDELGDQRHLDDVHVNPLKHGYVQRVADWRYSTFHREVARGNYPMDWCGEIDAELAGGG